MKDKITTVYLLIFLQDKLRKLKSITMKRTIIRTSRFCISFTVLHVRLTGITHTHTHILVIWTTKMDTN